MLKVSEIRMRCLVAVEPDPKEAETSPAAGEVLMPDIPAGMHNRFIGLESGRRCQYARMGAADIKTLDGLVDKMTARFPGLPARMISDLMADTLVAVADFKYDGLLRVMVTDSDATLMGVKDDDVVRQLWSGFNPAKYL